MLRPVQPVTLDTQIRPAPRAIADTMTQIHQVHSSVPAVALIAVVVILIAVPFVILDMLYHFVLVVKLDTMITLLLAYSVLKETLTA